MSCTEKSTNELYVTLGVTEKKKVLMSWCTEKSTNELYVTLGVMGYASSNYQAHTLMRKKATILLRFWVTILC